MKVYLKWQDVRTITGRSRAQAYRIIKALNKDLEELGFRTISGQVPIKFFCERYNLILADVAAQLTKEVNENETGDTILGTTVSAPAPVLA